MTQKECLTYERDKWSGLSRAITKSLRDDDIKIRQLQQQIKDIRDAMKQNRKTREWARRLVSGLDRRIARLA